MVVYFVEGKSSHIDFNVGIVLSHLPFAAWLLSYFVPQPPSLSDLVKFNFATLAKIEDSCSI